MADDRFQFRFRRLDDNIPDGWVSKAHWLVECYPAAPCDLPFPCGTAYVSDYTPYNQDLVALDFVLVADQFRRGGVGKALIAKCRERWPTIYLTDAIGPLGQRLLDSVEPGRLPVAKRIQAMKHEQRKKDRKRKKKERQRRGR